ncbi:thioredoxin [Candidatus Dojkabacteria bacterium]|uniref:Thioredoxin n=1 Tax=Candidatus Dojkabacteria bacterium TaxID=2099670 RepID=A0A955LAY7_9BACT|nr:thioredoxin [Candidatus Dojkabacteria bacterium]
MSDNANIKHTTDADFDKDTSQGAIIVDFWAEWCTPCRMIAPVLDEIATELDGKLKIVKLNVDENPATPPKFGVQGIPTLIMFKDGKLVDRIVGAMPKATLVQMIEKHL